MAFTGDLEHLHIVDVIQLIHTTRKSGAFAVRCDKGESRIIFSNGYIVGANHLNNKVRIGSVLVKMNVVTIEDLTKALDIQKNAGKNRKPLIATLIDMGKLDVDKASNGLRKLIEMTLVELIGWTKGTFTLDTDNIPITSELSYNIGKMEQELSIDAQMALMDALRIFDEQENERQAGREIIPDEKFFIEVLPNVETIAVSDKKPASITADDLGLGDLEHLERKMPESRTVEEILNPVEIHRQQTRSALADFSQEEQQAFASFLGKYTTGINIQHVSKKHAQQALILLSADDLLKYSVMTICKNEGILVFASEKEAELRRIISQCLTMKASSVIVFDETDNSGEMLSEEKISMLRKEVRFNYPQIPVVQLASGSGQSSTLQPFNDGVRSILPKPARKNKQFFIKDMMRFLETFNFYVKGVLNEHLEKISIMNKLKERMMVFRELNEPSDISFALLQFIAEISERAITFLVKKSELAGEWSIGVHAKKNAAPTSATKFKIPLTGPSVLRNVVETGKIFYGEGSDEILKEHLYKEIGAPLKPDIIIIPVKAMGKTIAVIYGDFGKKEHPALRHDILEIVAYIADMAMENTLYRKQAGKISQKQGQ